MTFLLKCDIIQINHRMKHIISKGVDYLAVTYNKLWKLLIVNVMARMGKNEAISFDSIEKICIALDCNIGDILDINTEIESEPQKRKFTSIELFAGAGGLAHGIEKAGLIH